MSAFELNKWIGAFLGTFLLVMVLSLLSDALFSDHHDHNGPAFLVEVTDAVSHAASEQTGAMESLSSLLLTADPNAALKTAKICGICHTFKLGGAKKIGPNLWDVVGRAKAAKEDFPYSSTLANLGGMWDYEALDAFLTSPKTFAPGTKMIFPGIKKPEVRANMIAYLRTFSDNPIALPAK